MPQLCQIHRVITPEHGIPIHLAVANHVWLLVVLITTKIGKSLPTHLASRFGCSMDVRKILALSNGWDMQSYPIDWICSHWCPTKPFSYNDILYALSNIFSLRQDQVDSNPLLFWRNIEWVGSEESKRSDSALSFGASNQISKSRRRFRPLPLSGGALPLLIVTGLRLFIRPAQPQ